METEELLKKRFADLAQKCYQKNQYTFTGFLGIADAACFYEIEKELSYVPYRFWGGYEDAERVMLRFGSKELLGYEEEFPIISLKVTPVSAKFADTLTHRDYLGALMNLGIERSTLGDIIIVGKHAFLFCTDKMAPYIMENLDRVRHTNVRCQIAGKIPESTITRMERKSVQVSAARADSIIAKVYNLSRSESVDLFRAKKVFVNGRLNENNGGQLKPDDKVTVRGFGRFRFVGVSGETRKGKLNVEVDIFC